MLDSLTVILNPFVSVWQKSLHRHNLIQLSRLLPVVVETIAHLIIKKNDDNKLAVETIARLPLFSAIN